MNFNRSKPIIEEMYNYWKINRMTFQETKALEQSIMALEKQVPKAIQFDDNDLNICPVCKEHVETDDKYCRNCGQRILLDLNNE